MKQKNIGFKTFFLINYLALGIITAWISRQALTQIEPWTVNFFTLAAILGYALFYLIPTIIITILLRKLAGNFAGASAAVTGSAATVLLLLVDSRVYAMYGFHINGFVWNLIATPGGFSSMGFAANAKIIAALTVFGILAGEWLLYVICRLLPYPGGRAWKFALTLVILCMMGERLAYGLSDLKAYRPVKLAAREIPFYIPATFKSAAEALGIKPAGKNQLDTEPISGRLKYPLSPLQVKDNPPTPNIVWLVAESLRGDMLNPEVMPNLWNFSKHAHRFTNHLSGGTGTRMGLFSMFYGLPGNYWFSFLDERRPPVIMQELKRRNYQFELLTSARFTYPEFDQTIFANISSSSMISDEKGPGWQRDRRNVNRLISFMDQSQKDNPFFAFLFFESPHARYYFPPEAVIRENYLPDFNYATVDIEKDIDLIFNRYVNACHHLDQQLGRILEHLQEKKMLDNTIVVVAGDHGEEFMEHGRWGHNSEFHNQQMHTPLVLWAPGYKGKVYEYPTSHLDLIPTLLPELGITSPANDYSLGHSLYDPKPHDYRLAASWGAVAYIGPEYKVAMPVKAGGLAEMTISRADDNPVANQDEVLDQLQNRLARVLQDLGYFYRKNR